MKRTISAKIPVAEPNILPGFDGELGFYKDVYYPDLASGESPAEFFLRHVLACAGYETKRIETAPTHPVLIIHAFCRSVMQSTDQRWLIRHFQGLLQRAGFRLRRDELMVARTGPRILITFLWRDSPQDYTGMLRQADEDAKQFADMPM